MNHINSLVINLIQKSLRFAMVIISLLIIPISVAVALGPDDKDKDKRQNRMPPPGPSRTIDSGSNRNDAPRYNPPQQQIRSDPPQVNRTFRNDNPPVQKMNSPPSFNPNPPANRNFTPPASRSLTDNPRVFRDVNPSRNANTPVLRNDPPKPVITSPPPTVLKSQNDFRNNQPRNIDRRSSSPVIPLPQGTANATSNQSRGNSSPITTLPQRTFTPNNRSVPSKDLQPLSQHDQRPSLSDTRKSLDDKRNGLPANSGRNNPSNNKLDNKTIDRPNDRTPVKSFDKPAGRTLDKPNERSFDKPGNTNIDKGGRLDRNRLDDGKMKNPQNFIPPKDTLRGSSDLRSKGNTDKSNSDRRDAFKPDRFQRGGKIDKVPSPPDLKGGDTAKDMRLDKKPGDVPKNFPIRKPGDISKDNNPGKRAGDKSIDFLPGRKPGDIGKDTKAGTKPDGDPKDILPGKKPNDIAKELPFKRPDDNKRGPDLGPIDRLPKNVRNEDMKKYRDNPYHKRFDERVKSGELEKVTKGEFAKKVNLSEQYKLMQKGDVARKLDLPNHTTKVININTVNHVTIANLQGIHPRHGFYCGTISPRYVNYCFKRPYYGYSFFAGTCWYPHWHPWVRWSWGYRCNPFWDPRPLWCRPIYYEPYIVWNYWVPPVWQPLPELSVGTWVDVKPVVVEPEQFDLQLLAVRMVDPGHPEEKLGPRYRVWFRNNSAQPVTNPFAVMIFASNDKRFGPELPKSGARVTSIEAGDTQSVDIRLPIEVATMNRDAAGQPAPFGFLHFFVDANREVNDTNMANNGVLVPRDEMLPVDPAAFEIDPVQSQPGGEMILAGEGLGPQAGQLLLHVGDREVQAEIVGWYDLGVKFSVPKMEIANPTEAEVVVVRGDGAAANPLKVTLLPDQGGPVLEMPAGQ